MVAKRNELKIVVNEKMEMGYRLLDGACGSQAFILLSP
jgi:hypothetical protein